MGDAIPIQSRTSLVPTSLTISSPPLPSSVSTAALSYTVIPVVAANSSTVPPAARNRAAAASTSFTAETPKLSTSSMYTSKPSGSSSPSLNPARMGLNSMLMAASASSSERTPARTRPHSSSRAMFQSWFRPRSGPRSTTATFSPASCSAQAWNTPRVPPATTTSYSVGPPPQASPRRSRTKTGAGPAAAPSFILRMAFQVASILSSPS
mmetsp:Transcript_13287/g.21077  ORF Transcript_13287/g.21077 Transcript_13287/m.21077 type:complete len:209 (-) Transcript_13287:401-1027(-)